MSVEAVSWALSVPVGGNEKIMLLGLANHAHPDGSHAFPTLGTLATYGHCDKATARRNVRKLEAAGWIERVGVGPNGQARYQLGMGDGKTQPPTKMQRGGGKTLAGGVAPVQPEPSLEPSAKAVSDETASLGERFPDALRLSRLLGSLILQNDPKATVTPETDRWVKGMQRVINKRGVSETEWVIRWCQADDFWRGNILSPGKLGVQFTQLLLKAKARRGSHLTGVAGRTQERLEQLRRLQTNPNGGINGNGSTHDDGQLGHGTHACLPSGQVA